MIFENLNEKENAVFAAIVENSESYGEGPYFVGDEIKVEGITDHQMRGYFSQLIQKGYIDKVEPGYYFDYEICVKY